MAICALFLCLNSRIEVGGVKDCVSSIHMCTSVLHTHTLSYLSVSGVCVVKSGQILLIYYNKFCIKCCKIVPV